MSWNLATSQNGVAYLEQIAVAFELGHVDIAGFQEISHPMAVALAERLDLSWEENVYYEETDKACGLLGFPEDCPFGNAIISTFPINDRRHWELAEIVGDLDESLGPRELLRATVTVGEQELHFYTVHMPNSATDSEKQGAASEMRGHIQLEAGTNPNFRAILVGDLNVEPNHPAVTAEVMPVFTDAWTVVHNETPVSDGPSFGDTGSYDNQGTPTRRIDYILVWTANGLVPKSVDLVGNSVISDHRGLVGSIN